MPAPSLASTAFKLALQQCPYLVAYGLAPSASLVTQMRITLEGMTFDNRRLASSTTTVPGIRANGQISAGGYDPQYDADDESKIRPPIQSPPKPW
ncbi:hypothetical protein IMSHALPRED_000001 [Imshaugia aleurites]|uniref:Uncharacterized protein n=1 Tax=Imshaugia aleurites TaxID=172621 RepID=A0A8H3HVQ6_9LECA|nr:hypothetical protein IMSHALPRED_000001 [Imshaugia aleurites]